MDTAHPGRVTIRDQGQTEDRPGGQQAFPGGRFQDSNRGRPAILPVANFRHGVAATGSGAGGGGGGGGGAAAAVARSRNPDASVLRSDNGGLAAAASTSGSVIMTSICVKVDAAFANSLRSNALLADA